MDGRKEVGDLELELNAFQRDALRELGNIASCHAVTALVELTGMTINIEVPSVEVVSMADTKKLIEEERIVAGNFIQLEGGFSSHLLVLFSERNALHIVDILLGRMPGETKEIRTEMEESALMETGNILASSFCDAIADFLQFSLMPSPPSFAFDMAGALVENAIIAVAQAQETEQIILFKSDFRDEANTTQGYILLFPHHDSLKDVLSSLDAMVTEGGGVIKMTKLAGIIQTFEPIFERMEITHAQEAAIYYVLSINNSSLNFTETLREARKIKRTVSQRALTKGRDYLVSAGYLAKVLFGHNSEPEEEFEHKGTIPVHPEIVFKENEEYLREIYEPDDFLVRKKQVEDFYSVYEDNYGEYGLKRDKGSVALHCNRKWIVSHIASTLTGTGLKVNTLSMVLSGLRVFEEPYRQYYEDIIGRGGEIRAIFGGAEEIEEMEETKALRNEYEESVKVRYNPAIGGTCKKFIIDDKLAMDGKKLLTMEGKGPSYLSILYLKEDESIKSMRRDFETLWKMSKELL